MNTDLHFSSKTDDWETPQEFFDKWNRIFHFSLDACATAKNAKCKTYLSKEDGLNSLELDWSPFQRVWMNPPYGYTIGKWIKKAYEESCKGCIVVCLIPARTDVRWWHDYVMRGVIHYVKGRLKFGGATKFAPFPSAVVVFMGNLLEGVRNER